MYVPLNGEEVRIVAALLALKATGGELSIAEKSLLTRCRAFRGPAWDGNRKKWIGERTHGKHPG